jgi:hypothetical protein
VRRRRVEEDGHARLDDRMVGKVLRQCSERAAACGLHQAVVPVPLHRHDDELYTAFDRYEYTNGVVRSQLAEGKACVIRQSHILQMIVQGAQKQAHGPPLGDDPAVHAVGHGSELREAFAAYQLYTRIQIVQSHEI